MDNSMIRPIAEADLSDCLDILKASYEASAITFGMTEDNCPYRGRTRLPLSELQKEFGNCQMYGYYNNDCLVGFLSLADFHDGSMGINDLAILPEYQCNGFGSEMIRFAKEEARRHGCSILRLGMIDENARLKKWYESHGFHTTRLEKYEKVTYHGGKMAQAL